MTGFGGKASAISEQYAELCKSDPTRQEGEHMLAVVLTEKSGTQSGVVSHSSILWFACTFSGLSLFLGPDLCAANPGDHCAIFLVPRRAFVWMVAKNAFWKHHAANGK